jgi:hypothetical protein
LCQSGWILVSLPQNPSKWFAKLDRAQVRVVTILAISDAKFWLADRLRMMPHNSEYTSSSLANEISS